MKKLAWALVLVLTVLFSNGLFTHAETPEKSGSDLYELNVMAKKIEPICKKYGYVARNSYPNHVGATCVDSDDNMMLSDVTPIFVAVKNNTNSISLAIDVIMQIGSRDTKAELLNVVAKAKKKTDYGAYAKGGTVVTVRSKLNEVHFMNYKSLETNKVSNKLNGLAKKIETTCKKYGYTAMNLDNDGAVCVNKKKEHMVIVDMGYVFSSPYKISKRNEIAVDVAYLLGKKESKPEMLRVIKLAQNTPHKTYKTKNNVPIASDKGGRVSIPFTKAKIDEANRKK